jgi:hypothetical protein
MSQKRVGENNNIRYSEAFKMHVVRDLEEKDLPFADLWDQRVRHGTDVGAEITYSC